MPCWSHRGSVSWAYGGCLPWCGERVPPERGGEGEEFTVLDRAGTLQLPRDYVERYGLRGRVRLAGETGHVGVWPDRDDRSDG